MGEKKKKKKNKGCKEFARLLNVMDSIRFISIFDSSSQEMQIELFILRKIII